ARGAGAAEVQVDPPGLDDRRGRGIAVERNAEGQLLDVEQLDVVQDLAGIAIDADAEELLAVLAGGGHPDLFVPDDRRGPALVVNGSLPDDVLLLAPLQRKVVGAALPVAVGATEGGPVVLCEAGERKHERGESK